MMLVSFIINTRQNLNELDVIFVCTRLYTAVEFVTMSDIPVEFLFLPNKDSVNDCSMWRKNSSDINPFMVVNCF